MATPSRAVQFRNIEAVLKAYHNRAVPMWAIFCAKQFLFKYEGDSVDEGGVMLNELLSDLHTSENFAIYTLCVYEEVDKIKDNTPHDGSFNFQLAEYQGGQRALPHNLVNENAALRMKVDALEARILDMEDEDDDNGNGDMLGQIEGFLQRPIVQQLIPVVMGALGLKMPGVENEGAAMGGVPGQMTLQEAILILQKNDPDLTAHLCMLAELSEKEPAKFKQVLGYFSLL